MRSLLLRLAPVALLVACGTPVPPSAERKPAPPAAAPVAPAPVASAPSPAPPSQAPRDAPPKASTPAVPPPGVATPPAASAPATPAKPAPPKSAEAPRAPAPPKAPPAAVPPKAPPAAAAPAPAPVAKAPAPPAMDLKSLEQRLKGTDAIGVLTKLSLKNQVDDLVARFKAFHAGTRPPTLVELRPAFDLLVMKVLSLLQDKDARLAGDIHASRDALWAVLADPVKLSQYD